MFNKLKQFKDIRERAKGIQSALAKERAEGSGGWGKVKVIMDGNQKVLDVMIDESLMKDKPALANAVKDAVNDAVGKIQRIMQSKMKDLGGDELAQDMQHLLGKKS
ncbi:YbaB/EbfC family nucleoid-associated protein [Patescibacteria group bacterium]|nr:YbaB/EbfC family nucleoid-associated protein [Patescibacteria group bacterium]MDL1953481.1 YbaB/EbfC family nucleoid-associated protein [Candidatus Uhrbacteria bacterium UHB]RIL00469.1 MAG: nucleoid-associated protein, YbaB/EbfC family [Candidatus Uhrbacteria bacterium]